MSESLHVYYSCDTTGSHFPNAISWNRCCCLTASKIPALLDLIDQDAIEIKQKFLVFLESIYVDIEKEVRCINKQNHGELSDILWNSSRFRETSNIKKSPAFTTLLKAFALCEFIEKSNYAKIHLVGFPGNLRSALSEYLRGTELVKSNQASEPSFSIGNLGDFLVRLSKLFGYFFLIFCQAIEDWVSGRQKTSLIQKKADIVFVDYLYEFEAEKIPHYNSKYWGALPKHLDKMGINVFWCHLFVPHPKTPDSGSAKKIVDLLNKYDQKHILVERNSSLIDLISAMRVALVVWFSSWRLRKKIKTTGLIPFWEILEFEWKRSFESPELLKNLLLHKAFSRHLPSPRTEKSSIVYVCENQPWEHLLCRSAAAGGFNRIIGSIQSSTRFWDFRYLQNLQKQFFEAGKEFLAPTQIACNAEEQKKMLAATPQSCLYQVESFRMGNQPYAGRNKNVPKKFILIAGEYSDSHTRGLLDTVALAQPDKKDDLEFYFRPHPSSCMDITSKYGKWLSYLPDGEDPVRAAMVITVANTSFSAECWEMGVRLACYVDVSDLNMSPLYRRQGVSFFSCPSELYSIIKRVDNLEHRTTFKSQIYNSNKGFTKWENLLTA